MSGSTHTTLGAFRAAYRRLARERAPDGSKLAEQVPVVLVEGDSWFSTPLYTNMADAVAQRAQGLYLRIEKPGDTARNMFAKRNLARLRDHLETFAFDAVLLSAGGNDLVDEFLAKLFRGVRDTTPDDALQRVRDSGRLEQVRKGYDSFVALANEVAPDTHVIAHTYAYPRLLGTPAQLTIQQIGLIALFKHQAGDWIDKHIRAALPRKADRVEFVNALMDAFHAEVLQRVPGTNFHVVDLRKVIPLDRLWNDEMHPTAEGFGMLAELVRRELRKALPSRKRAMVDP